MTPPAVLSDVLVLLADLDDARILPRRTVCIAVERVLAWSWNAGRLERCQRARRGGESAADPREPLPAERVDLVRGERWPSPHRCREGGRPHRIAAIARPTVTLAATGWT
jgi:hypothetical protein